MDHLLMRHAPPLALRGGWVDDLVARHTGGGRRYHTVQHLGEMLDAWAGQQWEDPVAAWLGVVLHDAVYVVGASDNEARSAELVPAWVQRFVVEPAGVSVPRVQALILETARHGDHGPLDADTALFVDCDMAILAAPSARFAEYERQVREEWVPVVGEGPYDAGRRAFFAGLEGRPIFQSDPFASLEGAAQANVRSALYPSSSSDAPRS